MPDFEGAMALVLSKFDRAEATKNKKIVAFYGLNPQYDDACTELQSCKVGDRSIKVGTRNTLLFYLRFVCGARIFGALLFESALSRWLS